MFQYMLYRRVTIQGFRKNLVTTYQFRLPGGLRSSSVIPASHAGCCKDVQHVCSDHELGDTAQSNMAPCKAAAQARCSSAREMTLSETQPISFDWSGPELMASFASRCVDTFPVCRRKVRLHKQEARHCTQDNIASFCIWSRGSDSPD